MNEKGPVKSPPDERFDPQKFRTQTDAGELPSEAVIRAVASIEGTDPADLDMPLFYSIDPERLDTLIETMSDGEVTFEYFGYSVTVESTGAIQIEHPARDD